MLDNLQRQVASLFPARTWTDFPIIAAVSGGPDSVAMLRILVAIRQQVSTGLPPLIVAHFNHGLRGTESNADARFVQQLAENLGLDFQLGQPINSASGSEESFRQQRYTFLIEVANRVSARLIATGHTADDQAETILFRILRGSGLHGLAGIPSTRRIHPSLSLVRPLLQIRRREIEQWLNAIEQPVRFDESNASDDFTRNFLRNQFLPQVQTRFANDIHHSLNRLGQQAEETEAFLQQHVDRLETAIRTRLPARVELDLGDLADQPLLLIRGLLRKIWRDQQWPEQEMTFEIWQQLAQAIERNLPGPSPSEGRTRQPSGAAIESINLPGRIRFQVSPSVASFEQFSSQ